MLQWWTGDCFVGRLDVIIFTAGLKSDPGTFAVFTARICSFRLEADWGGLEMRFGGKDVYISNLDTVKYWQVEFRSHSCSDCIEPTQLGVEVFPFATFWKAQMHYAIAKRRSTELNCLSYGPWMKMDGVDWLHRGILHNIHEKGKDIIYMESYWKTHRKRSSWHLPRVLRWWSSQLLSPFMSLQWHGSARPWGSGG